MADNHITELHDKVAHYEAVMSNCPQCKASILAPEAENTRASSRNTRSSRSAEQPAAKVPPQTLTASPKRRTPASALPLAALSSQQLERTSRTELQADNSERDTPLIPPTESSSQSHQTPVATISTRRKPSTISSVHPNTSSVTGSAGPSSSRQPNIRSRTPPSRPSSAALSTADGRHSHSGKLVDLGLQQQEKSVSQNRVPRHAEWMRTANIMLEEVPLGRHWREKVTQMDSSIIAAVAIDIVPIPEGDVSPKEDVERKKLIKLVRKFAERHSEVRVNFEHFILVCLCKVLSSQGVSRDKIVETLQICISDTHRRNIDRYLYGATWANRILNELFLTDWGYRAVDLIAIWNRSVATYGSLASAADSRQYFITELTQREYFEGYQEVPNRRHDTIPWIVKREVGSEVSYRDVCKALDYSDDFFIKTEHLHSSNSPSPKLNAGDMDGAGFQSRRDSVPTASQAQSGTSNVHRPTSVDETPSNYPSNSSYYKDVTLIRRQLHQEDSPEATASRNPPTSQSVASQKPKRMIPDRSAKPLGDPDISRQRTKPREILSSADLPSAVSTQSAKRPLPESPTSAFPPINATRRRFSSSSEESDPTYHPGKKGSKDRRGRA